MLQEAVDNGVIVNLPRTQMAGRILNDVDADYAVRSRRASESVLAEFLSVLRASDFAYGLERGKEEISSKAEPEMRKLQPAERLRHLPIPGHG